MRPLRAPPFGRRLSAAEHVVCGIAFVVLFTVGVVLQASASVDLKGTAAQVAASYDDHEVALLVAERILVLAVFFLFAFIGGVGSALRRAEGPGGWLPGVAVAGGAAAAVLLLAAVGSRSSTTVAFPRSLPYSGAIDQTKIASDRFR